MELPKIYIGAMSQNVVDTVIEFEGKVGLIPSRRQVDYKGGYVNNWTTKTLSKYVDGMTVIERDHGGTNQGDVEDSGIDSFMVDANAFQLIHVDPWKGINDFNEALEYTCNVIKMLNALNPNLLFEVGTEESIRGFQPGHLYNLLYGLKSNLQEHVFKKIKYAVIQSGVGLDLPTMKNIGKFDKVKLRVMNSICNDFGITSKEHNGDYLTKDEIELRFSNGLGAINLAPEFGQIETMVYIDTFSDEDVDLFHDLCSRSTRWKKWASGMLTKRELMLCAGHYVFSDPSFVEIKSRYENVDIEVKAKLKTRIEEILNGKPKT